MFYETPWLIGSLVPGFRQVFSMRTCPEKVRRNIAVDAETVQLAAAVQAALQADAPSRLARRRPRAPATGSEPLF